MKDVMVALPAASYRIHIERGAIRELPKIGRQLGAGKAVVVTDENVAQLHVAELFAAFASRLPVFAVKPGEASKSLDSLSRVYDFLAQQGVERGDLIVAFGGGVVGDLAGLAAATWLRGIQFIQAPTTMEAAIDASVGGKTGINHAAGKNLIGAFHQPAAVLVDTAFLDTLPDRDYRAGLAESVKHGVVRDAAFFQWQERHAKRILARNPAVVEELIASNCRIKARVVELDEREAGLRAVLNYGHTIGHALEHVLGYALRHGECVSLGMIAENHIAVRRGLLAAEAAERISDLLSALGLPARLEKPVDASAVAAACRKDKKSAGGRVNFVLAASIGETVRADDVTEAEVVEGLGVISG